MKFQLLIISFIITVMMSSCSLYQNTIYRAGILNTSSYEVIVDYETSDGEGYITLTNASNSPSSTVEIHELIYLEEVRDPYSSSEFEANLINISISVINNAGDTILIDKNFLKQEDWTYRHHSDDGFLIHNYALELSDEALGI